MAWLFLFIAGLLETAWASALKALGTRFSLGMAAFALVTMAASLWALWRAMSELPLGVAYPIWTGLGTVGAVLVSQIYFAQPLSMAGWLGLACILVGIGLIFSQTS